MPPASNSWPNEPFNALHLGLLPGGIGGATSRFPARKGTVGAWRSLVSALVWGTRGRGFESRRSDHSGGIAPPHP